MLSDVRSFLRAVLSSPAPEDEARAALAERAQSGESVAAFTRSRGFSAPRIRCWTKRLRETAAVAGSVPGWCRK